MRRGSFPDHPQEVHLGDKPQKAGFSSTLLGDKMQTSVQPRA
jgi:hypothetical protein